MLIQPETCHYCTHLPNVLRTADAIRRNVYAALEGDHNWNEVVFMKTLKSVVSDGEVEQCTVVNCALSPEYKRRRANSLTAYVQHKKGSPVIPYMPAEQPPAAVVNSQPQSGCECEKLKLAPKRKAEHDKYKIMPKALFDRTL
jgi:hypothetical protein